MPVTKELSLLIRTKGMQGALQSLDHFRGGAVATFSAIAKSAAAVGISIGVMAKMAIDQLTKVTEKYREFEKNLENSNRMLGMAATNTGVLEQRLKAIVTGPLGVAPDLINQSAEALYSYTSALGKTDDMVPVYADLEAAIKSAAATHTPLTEVMEKASRIARATGQTYPELKK